MVTDSQSNQNQPVWVNYFDTALLFFICVTTGLRPLLSEVITTSWNLNQSQQLMALEFNATPIVLFFSACHISLLSVWLLVHAFTNKQWVWQKTMIVPGLILMTIAFGISTINAGNQYLAIVGSVTWLSHLALGIVLVQLLKRHWHRQLIIGLLIFVATMMSYRCWEQVTYEMPQLAQQIGENPDFYLKQQGIAPDTFKAAHFLKRVASKDIGGFYIISNTAASFFILSICGILGFMIYAIKQAPSKDKMFNGVLAVLLLGFLALGIRYTESKGGIVALMVAIGCIVFIAITKILLVKHIHKLFIIVLLLIITAISSVIIYGITTQSLPGNSMLVRWQYWEGVMRIDHFTTGVGSHNFSYHYLKHMSPGAPESVQDPHNIFLSFLSQWGILGLVGFLSIIGLFFYHLKNVVGDTTRREITDHWGRGDLKKYTVMGTLAIVVITVLRFLFIFNPQALNEIEYFSIVIISFIIPAIIGFVAFLISVLVIKKSIIPDNETVKNNYYWLPLTAALGVAACLLQNSIDFALFQPSIGQLFFVIIALTMAFANTYTQQRHTNIPTWAKPVALGCCLITALLWIAVVIPFSRSHRMIEGAQIDGIMALDHETTLPPYQKNNLLNSAINKAQKAQRLCKIDPAPLKLHCQLISALFNNHTTTPQLNAFQALLDKTIILNRYNYGLYKMGGDVLAPYLNKQAAALNYYRRAYDCYPVSPSLAYAYGKLLLKSKAINNIALAKKVFTDSLKYEDAFKQQALEMFGDQRSWDFRMDPKHTEEITSLLEKL